MSSSDEEWGFYQYRALLAVGLLFGGLCVFSVFDLVFLLIGREGTATIAEVYKLPGRRQDYWEMEFKYKDSAGNERTGKYNLGETSDGRTVGEVVAIQYLPMWLLDAPDAARPKRPFNWPMLTMFLLASAGFGFFAYRAINPPDEARPKSKRRR